MQSHTHTSDTDKLRGSGGPRFSHMSSYSACAVVPSHTESGLGGVTCLGHGTLAVMTSAGDLPFLGALETLAPVSVRIHLGYNNTCRV